ncbi:MAG: LTA synthase family protein [bacterium]
MAEPLSFADFILAKSLPGHSDLLENYITNYTHLMVIGAVFVLLTITLLKEKPLRFSSLQFRLASIIVLVALVSYLPVRALLLSPYHKAPEWQAWDQKHNVKKYGLAFSLLHDLSIVNKPLPKPDETAIESAQSVVTQEKFRNPQGQPEVQRVVVILSESYFNPDILNEVPTGAYQSSELRKVLEKALQGQIAIPAYGGGTLRTEYELLTGVSLDLFPDYHYPFISLVLKPQKSIVWDYLHNGYSTIAVHPNLASFWSRDRTYPFLGFEKFLDIKQFAGAKRSGYYISDHDFTSKLISQISSDKQFIYGISMENHGPWKEGRPNLEEDKVHAIKVPEKLSAQSTIALQQYVYHMGHAQEELVRLVKHLQGLPSRSIVLFFGDHLPGLGTVFDELGFKNKQSRYMQTTPYYIFDTHQDLSQGQYSHSTIDVELLGSILRDISHDNISKFHTEAEYFAAKLGSDNKEVKSKALYMLHQLQLERFWSDTKEGKHVSSAEVKPNQGRENHFCEIKGWGPKTAIFGEGFNVIKDGRSAFWLETDCAPEQVQFEFNEQQLETVRRLPIITAAMIPDHFISEAGTYKISLYDPVSGQRIDIGDFVVESKELKISQE